MRRLILVVVVVSLVFTFSPLVSVAASQLLHWETDFESGIPPEMMPPSGPNFHTCASTLPPDTFWPSVAGNMGLGTGLAGAGLHEAAAVDGIGDKGVYAIVFENVVDIDFVSAWFYGIPSANNKALQVWMCAPDGTQVYYFFTGPISSGLPGFHFQESNKLGVAAIMFASFENENAGYRPPEEYAAFEAYLDDISIDYYDTGVPFDHQAFGDFGGASRYKPVSSPDIFSVLDENRTVWANKKNPNVHSITSGNIHTITDYGGTWSVTIAPAWAESDDDFLTYENLQSINGKLGDQVSVGCVLGLAVTSSTGGSYPVGKLTMALPDDIAEDWPDYPDSPHNIPCDVDAQSTPNCVDLNPNFANDALYWNRDGHVESGPQGVTLYSDAAIYQDVVLDDANPYLVTIYATTTLGATTATIDVSFGEASASLHLSVPAAMQWVKLQTQALAIGAADYAPDAYRLRIQNTAPTGHLATPVLIKFVCIGTTSPTSAPGSCYFDDPDLTTDYWESDAEVTYATGGGFTAGGSGGTGTYTIPATKAIWHAVDISAFSDAATTFHLRTMSSNGNGTPLTPPYGRWHAYIRDATTHDLIQEIGYWDTNPIIGTDKTLNFSLVASEHVAGELIIINETDDINPPGWDLKIHSICLSVEGDVWPGYDNNDTGALFVAECALCTQPAPIETVSMETLLGWIASWLAYGWCYLGYILKCIIVSIINSIWASVLSIIMGVGLFGVWLGRVIGMAAAWAADGARFHGNNLIASLIPVANLVISWLFTVPFILSAIDALSLAGIWLQALFDLVVAVFNLFGLALQLIGALLNLIGVAWTAFLTAINGTSSVTFPFPNCTNPSSFLYDACLPLDVANFLFGEVPMLGLLVNASVFAIGWKTVRKAWQEAQEALLSS